MIGSEKNRPLRVGIWPPPTSDGNPFVKIFSDSLREQGNAVVDVYEPADCDLQAIDIFHIHWPEAAFWGRGGTIPVVGSTVRTLVGLWRMKRSGIPIVWMVHNLDPHDLSPKRRLLWAVYRHYLCRLVSGYMTLCPATVDVVRAALPELRGKPYSCAWHPAYPRAGVSLTKLGVRRLHGIESSIPIISFVGLVRQYKGIEMLVEAFRGLPDGFAHLLIAGRVIDENYGNKLRQLIMGDRRISLVLRHLSDAEYSEYLRASDLTVVPFEKTLHSGSLIHAVSELCPVLTADKPFARALQTEVGRGWVKLYQSRLTVEALMAFDRPEAPPDLSSLTSMALSKAATGLYKKLAGMEK